MRQRLSASSTCGMRVALRLAASLVVAACGTGLSLDPTSRHLGEDAKFDGGDATEAATFDASPDDAKDELDVSLSPSDADVAVMDATDVADSTDGAEEPTDDVGFDNEVGEDDVGEVKDAAFDADAMEAGDGCTVACGWPDADYYVDARALVDGDGSKQKPFKTITSAIVAYQHVLGQPRKVYVAAGTYDQALGEKFPLVLRGLSLEGAGKDQTFVVGTGTLVHSGEGGPLRDQYLVSVVSGDRLLPTVVAGISIRPQSPVPTANVFGVFCDRGNALSEIATAAGQTKLDQVTVGPGYHASVLATSSTLPSATGCNVVIRSSILTGGWAGLRALGCPARVLVEMGGPDPSDGNVVSWMQAPNDGAAGVRLEGCVHRGSFQNNAFVDSVYGIDIDENAGGGSAMTTFTITHNSFERLSAGGIRAWGIYHYFDELSDNRFVGITRAVTQDPGTPAVALAGALHQLGKVRRNLFIGNDFGVQLRIAAGGAAKGRTADFGTVADPGGNVFRCNSALKGTGADLSIGQTYAPGGTWPSTIQLAGNAWDHAPPTVRNDATTPNGCDISTIALTNVNFDIQNSSLATAECPVDRVPGQ